MMQASTPAKGQRREVVALQQIPQPAATQARHTQVAPLGAVGCGNPILEPMCQPACPPGFHCTEQGCASDDGRVPDLAVPSVDMAGCSLTCAAPTPYCTPERSCAACLEDSHCPIGQICKTVGVARACVRVYFPAEQSMAQAQTDRPRTRRPPTSSKTRASSSSSSSVQPAQPQLPTDRPTDRSPIRASRNMPHT